MTMPNWLKKLHLNRTLTVVATVAALVGAGITVAAMVLFQKPATPASVTIAVVGDSYAAGRLNRVVWPTLLAQRTGWSVSNFALPGSGFAADGPGGYAFTWQVDRALAANPHTVLIAGGVDDGGFSGTGNITQGAVDAINKVIRAGKQVLVMGPIWWGLPVPPTVTGISDEIQKATEQADVPFLNTLDPPWLGPDQMLADKSGPNDDGQSMIADKVAAWVRTEVKP